MLAPLPEEMSGFGAPPDESAPFSARLDDSEAVLAYQRALVLEPRNVEALVGLANTLQRLGRLEEALQVWQRVIAAAPGRGEAYINQGNVLYDLQRYEDALARYTRALQHAPNNALAYRQVGRVLLKLARFEEALAAYQQASVIAPKDASSLLGKGFALEALGQRDRAISAYTRAIQVDPGNVEATLHAGQLLLRRRRTSEVQALARQVLALNERNQGAWLIQGAALMSIGSYQGALAAYERAIQVAPDDRRGYQGKARALDCLGRHEEAEGVLKQAPAPDA